MTPNLWGIVSGTLFVQDQITGAGHNVATTAFPYYSTFPELFRIEPTQFFLKWNKTNYIMYND